MVATVTVPAELTTSALATTESTASLPGLFPIALEEPAQSKYPCSIYDPSVGSFLLSNN